ncbi:hypothetical protein [Clostridium sp.]|uniref:hypothetical protein n=1 Tax=Clostridium sp. TaxID=1506 RepID=UPI00258C0E14|nr:hypothetical protein [Clostridium sp.]MDF2503028.1 hypothetical protein [Clostridium sp.]
MTYKYLEVRREIYEKNPSNKINSYRSFSIIVMVLLFSQISRERYLYNESERANELSQKMQGYEQYVSEVWKILQDCSIDTPEKVQNLKTECEKTLKIREDKFMKINSKIVDMLIGVPLGALIASLIYADSKAAPITIGTIILGGLAILGILKLVYLISYYSEGYFKDKYLLEALSELDYFNIIKKTS